MSGHDRKLRPGQTTPLSGSPVGANSMMDYMGQSSASRRSSGNFARLAFSIYGGNSQTSNTSASSGQSPIPHMPPAHHSHHRLSVNSVQYYAPAEILCMGKSNENSNVMAIGGQKMLQIVKVSGSDVVVETDIFSTGSSSIRTKFSSASDIKFGFSHFSKVFAVGTISGAVYTHNILRGSTVQTMLNEHTRAVNSIDFSSQAPHNLVSGSQDGTLKIWDLRSKTNKAVTTIYGVSDAVRCVQFSPHNGRKLASIFDSGVIKKWDLRNPSQYERRLTAHTGPGLTLDWHPEFDYILSGGRDKQLQVWNMASDSSKEPDFVIGTSGAISRASWCPFDTNSTLLSTDIAISFLTDDPCVQIWNLSRKYIPQNVIDYHSNQVTGVVWSAQDKLWTCSRDRMMAQHDLKTFPRPLDNVAPAAVAWNNSSSTELCFVQQDKYQFEKNMALPVRPHVASSIASTDSMRPPLASVSTTPTSITTPSTIPGTQNWNNTMARSQTYRPQLTRTGSQLAHVEEAPVDSPYTCPVNLPLRDNNPQVFEFLASHYLIDVPDSMDIASVCEYNASIAASAKKFRDCQTWRTIKASILWQTSEEACGNRIYESEVESQKTYRIESKKDASKTNPRSSMMTVDSQSSFDMGSVPSDTFGIGSASPVSNVFAKAFKSGLSALEGNAKARALSGVSVQSMQSDKRSLLTEKLEKLNLTEKARENENAISDTEEGTETPKGIPIERPVATKNRKSRGSSGHHRFTYRGESAPDFDDERNLAGSNFSRSPYSLKSSLSSSIKRPENLHARTDSNLMVQPLVKTSRAASRVSGRSELTELLKEHSKDGADYCLNVPWAPSSMIQHAADYSAQQGDIIMCATLALLFARKYRCFSRRQVEDWVYSYHEILSRRLLFGVAADVVKISSRSLESMKQKGQTDTSMRTYCGHCGSLILNEQTKNKKDEEGVEFGFWYCERCNKMLGGCIYCNEAVKGMAVCLLECGHRGHFGCLKRWFLEEQEKDCPAGCGFVALR